MESWRRLAIKLFPERQSLYEEEQETVWFVLSDLQQEIVEAHEANNTDRIERIYQFAEWCHSQKEIDPEVWTAAYAGFYEHLIEHEATFKAIPQWVKPEVFQDMLEEFRDRLDNKAKYPYEHPGTFDELLSTYDAVNGTSFAKGSRFLAQARQASK